MKQYSFLTESKKKLLKRLSKYTPEEIAKIREKMLSIGKENGGWYDPAEYAHRILKGQLKRAKKICPDIKLEPVKDIFSAQNERMLNGGVILKIPNNKSHATVPFSKDHFKTKKEYKKALKDYYRSLAIWNKDPHPNSAPHRLTRADTVSHEVDELSSAYKTAMKHGITPFEVNDVYSRIYKEVNPFAGNHNPRVLRREANRHHLLNTLYGRGSYISPPRTHTEYRLNQPLSKEDMFGAINGWDYNFKHIH